ncbi:MAG: hypothetical protein H7Y18_01690 [Clostridiaceae bacterium]|nr:hypothetical protein [Clostridiaceae bacterium]
MPGINNISNVNNLDSKRVVSKLSFQVGEVFQGRIVEVEREANNIVLKTKDGWQFTANAKIPLENLPKGLVRFKVVGYEEGKLQLEILPDEENGTNVPEKSIQTILKQQNLSSNKADFEMLKSMVSHNIPLTKENISSVKVIIDFKEKISANIEEEDNFISKYLQSKGIDINSLQGKNINQLLKGFFSELKKVSVEDLVTLKENGIDITEDNLKSFNKVFKEDIGLYKEITQHIKEEGLIGNKTIYSSINGEESLVKPKSEAEIIKQYLDSENITPNSGKGKEINNGTKEFFDVIKKEPDKEIFAKFQLDSFKETIKAILIGNDISVTKENVSLVKTIIELKEEILGEPKNETEIIKKYLDSKNITEGSGKGKEINNSLKEFLDVIKKEPVKEILAKLQLKSESETEIGNIKSFNKQFKEDLPVFKEIIKTILNENNLNKSVENSNNYAKIDNSTPKENIEHKVIQNIIENDIPLTKENVSIVKTIIELKEEILSQPKNENELIKQYLNSKDIPEDSEKGKALSDGIKELFNQIKKEPIKEVLAQIQSSTDEKAFGKQFKEDLPIFKELLKNIFKGNDVNKGVENIKNNQLAEDVKTQIAQKTDFMKDIIKGISEGDWSQMKNSINNIKVFNTVSNQYYYMDVPVNVDQRQYECKLLIKDDRKKGKKIDSKNVKMFVSVKTINMGKVDAYIKVSDRNVDIDLKCNENWIKVLEKDNHNLVSTLKEMNYNVILKIESQTHEANIVTTREFFQDNAIGSINVMV